MFTPTKKRKSSIPHEAEQDSHKRAYAVHNGKEEKTSGDGDWIEQYLKGDGLYFSPSKSSSSKQQTKAEKNPERELKAPQPGSFDFTPRRSHIRTPNGKLYKRNDVLGEGSYGKTTLFVCASDFTAEPRVVKEQKSMAAHNPAKPYPLTPIKKEAELCQAVYGTGLINTATTKDQPNALLLPYFEGQNPLDAYNHYLQCIRGDHDERHAATRSLLAICEAAANSLTVFPECRQENYGPLVHGDVKSFNMLLKLYSDGLPQQLVLLDLGLTRKVGEETLGAGNPSYHAPEIARSKVPAATNQDVFSLGIFFQHLCCSYAHAYPDSESRIITQLRELIAKMTQKDPSKRSDLKTEIIPTLQSLLHENASLAYLDTEKSVIDLLSAEPGRKESQYFTPPPAIVRVSNKGFLSLSPLPLLGEEEAADEEQLGSLHLSMFQQSG